MTLGYVVRTSTRDVHKSELVKIIIMKCSNTHSHYISGVLLTLTPNWSFKLQLFDSDSNFLESPNSIKYIKNPTFFEIPHFYSNFQNPSENSESYM